MDSSKASAASPGIAALPVSTTRQLGSGQVLVDPSSVVKELIDNALDARAKSIFVDITLNTIDSIQVKDDGHGIASEDRPLACRRYCTSKIRDFHDLKEVGGKWLGFRGEALASLAGMSQTLSVTTRAEGEPVAVKLKYGRDGELVSTERDSHPVGTTVTATHFLECLPVRKQTALKNSCKTLAKIRRTMQAYALARPNIRFRLHVLKANNNKNDFIYAPHVSSNVEDAAIKVIGKTYALQCEWTATEADGYEIHAFLPKPEADPLKISGPGPFVSVDSRPMASNRGTVKKLVAMLKKHLRKSASMSDLKDPFFFMNIVCPPDSYDLNVEPAKDDVMFDDENDVLVGVEKLLDMFYSGSIEEMCETEPPMSAQRPQELADEDEPNIPISSLPLQDIAHNPRVAGTQQDPHSAQPRWRSSMYGMDEDDLQFLQENEPPDIEEEAGIRDVTISNPWTIARINAVKKPNVLAPTPQLLSPDKTLVADMVRSSSPSPLETPHRLSRMSPVTPRSMARGEPVELKRPIAASLPIRGLPQSFMLSADDHVVGNALAHSLDNNQPQAPRITGRPPNRPYVIPMLSNKSHQSKKKQRQPQRDATMSQEDQGPNCTWFGQSMIGSQPGPAWKPDGKRKAPVPPLFPVEADPHSKSRPQLARHGDPSSEVNLISANNTDIRDFFTLRSEPEDLEYNSSFAKRVSGLTYHSPERSLPGACLHLSVNHEQASSLTPRGMADPLTCLHPSSDIRLNAQSASTKAPAITTQNSPELRVEARDMEAHFKAYQARENGFVNTLQLSPRDEAARVNINGEPSHRPKSTTETRRRKSSRAPLEHVPRGFHTQNIILRLALSIKAIQKGATRLEVAHDNLTWGRSPIDNHNAFIDMHSEDRVATWVQRLDGLLHRQFAKIPDTNIHVVLHEGIHKGLAVGQLDQKTRFISPAGLVIHAPFDQVTTSHQAVSTPVPEEQMIAAQKKVGKWMDEFDMSQFVHLEEEDDRIQGSPGKSLGSSKVDDAMDEDIGDDDMLMSA